MDVYEIFRKYWPSHKEQTGAFWGWCLWPPWIQDSFFYFLYPCFLSASRNNGWMDIHYILRYGHKGQLARLFHAWIDYFTLPKLGTAAVCALSVLLVFHLILCILYQICYSVIRRYGFTTDYKIAFECFTILFMKCMAKLLICMTYLRIHLHGQPFPMNADIKTGKPISTMMED